jgi:hypothetical protein
MVSEQPSKGAAHETCAISRWQISMGSQDPFDLPGENPVERAPRRATVKKARAPIFRHAGVGGDDPAVPANDAAPAGEPVAREILDRIGKKDGATHMMKEYDLGQVEAPPQDDLVDIGRPCGFGHIAKAGIEREIPAFAPQPWRRIETLRRMSSLPFSKKNMMQRVGRDKMTDRAKHMDRFAKRVRERDGRPDEKAFVSKADHRHPRWIGKAVKRHHRAVSYPDLMSELPQLTRVNLAPFGMSMARANGEGHLLVFQRHTRHYAA